MNAIAIIPLLLALWMPLQAMEDASPLPAADMLPETPTLPDPFLKPDGGRVADAGEWPQQRAWLKRLIQHYGYGFLPSSMPVVARETSSRHDDGLKAILRTVELSSGTGLRFTVDIAIPDGEGPFPAIVVGDRCWKGLTEAIRSEVVGRGYILAEFDRTEIVPDKDGREDGLYTLIPDREAGAVIAWAWGFHRVIDHLLTLPVVDGKHLAVTGHSRGGKAALLAGALDERIALTAPNNSGCGGAGCLRALHGKCETLPLVLRRFPWWFSPRLAAFADQVPRLPFDMHTLKALVAPRALLSTEGLGDLWANPHGTQVTHQAARMVYDFLGVGDRIGIAFREGGHAHGLEDWRTLLDFADVQFFGRKHGRRFDALAFPDDGKRWFGWTIPASR